MATSTFITLVLSISLLGLALGAVTRRDVTTGRHSLQHQMSDDLEDQLHELRIKEETNLDDTSGTVGETPRSLEVSSDEAQSIPRDTSRKLREEQSWPETLRLQDSDEDATSISDKDGNASHVSKPREEVNSEEQSKQEEEQSNQEEQDSDSKDNTSEDDTSESTSDDTTASPQVTSTPADVEMSTSVLPRRSLPYGLRHLSSDKRDAQESDERVLTLMMQLAQNPKQWERVHHELEHLDRELMASRRAVQMLGVARSNDAQVGNTGETERLPDVATTEVIVNSQRLEADGEATTDTKPHEDTPTEINTNIAGTHAKILQGPKSASNNGNTVHNAAMPDPLILENEAQRTSSNIPTPRHHHRNIGNTANNVELPDPLVLDNEAERSLPPVPSSVPSPHHHPHGSDKHWPQFAYHRVTANPADSPSLSHHGQHHNAYIAVSAVTPPKLRSRNQHLATTPASHREQLPDAMDDLITKIPRPPLHRVTSTSHVTHEGVTSPENEASSEIVASEEQEIEDLVQSGWNHEEHRHKLVEQMQALESLHAQLEARWRQLSRDVSPAPEHQARGPNHNTP